MLLVGAHSLLFLVEGFESLMGVSCTLINTAGKTLALKHFVQANILQNNSFVFYSFKPPIKELLGEIS